MMKKGIYSLLAVLTVLAVVLTGCPSDPGPESTQTPTYTVTFDSKGGSAVDPITGVKSGDTISAPTAPSHTSAGIEFLDWYKDENCTAGNQWSFGSDTVTKDITLYAKWGRDASLDMVKLGSANLLDTNGASIGMPSDILDKVGAGIYEVNTAQPAGGIAITVTPKIASAQVKWVIKATDPTETEFDNATNPSAAQTFGRRDSLYIRITNSSGANDPYTATLYYKINFYFAVIETIPYGQPTLEGSDTTAVDPLWEANYGDGPVFDISRVNKAEVAPPYKFFNTVKPGENHTSGTAKAYWDDNGLYIYATVTFNDYYEDEAAKAAGTATSRVTQMRGNFESDSFEIMVNARKQLMTSGTEDDPDPDDTCVQFRVGFKDDGSAVSDVYTNTYGSFLIGGNFRSNPYTPELNSRHIFGQTLQFNAWKTMDGTKETGYKIIARVPWALIGDPNASDVFDNDGKVKNDAQIGLDFQINASTTPQGETPARDATLTCSSVAAQALTNSTKFAQITLAAPTTGSREDAEAIYPTIDGNSPPSLDTDGETMKIPAYVATKITSLIGLSYDWWSADDATGDGASTGVTTATYKPADGATGKYFWVKVTNTVGESKSTVTSRRFQYQPTGGSGTPGDGTVVWEPTITASTPINTTADPEYIGNTGIQAGDKANTTLGVVAGGFTVGIKAGESGYKPINIQVGTACGGTDYYNTEGFHAVANTDYTITFMASVNTGTGQIRFKANGGSFDGGHAISTTPTELTFSWKQTATGGNFQFDTGTTPTTSVITITGIKITTP
jgi:hypothetical protein